jgi:hypothetical protein
MAAMQARNASSSKQLNFIFALLPVAQYYLSLTIVCGSGGFRLKMGNAGRLT